MKIKHRYHHLLWFGVLLLLLGLVLRWGGWTQLHWPMVTAQVQDVQVVSHIQATEQPDSTPRWLVQYAYKYVWEGREYINRDLIPHTQPNTNVDGLTSQEYEYWLLRQGPTVWEPIVIRVNPKYPGQSMLYQAPQAPRWLMIGGALLCAMGLGLRLR